jgi:hypothetical protein
MRHLPIPLLLPLFLLTGCAGVDLDRGLTAYVQQPSQPSVNQQPQAVMTPQSQALLSTPPRYDTDCTTNSRGNTSCTTKQAYAQARANCLNGL